MSFREIHKCMGELRRAGGLSPQDVRALQEKRFRALLKYTVTHSPFYRSLYAGIDIERCDITALPPVTKYDLMAHFNEAVTRPDLDLKEAKAWLAVESNIGKKYKDKYVLFQSSGTSGFTAVVVNEQEHLNWLYSVFGVRQALPRLPGVRDQLRQLGRNLLGNRIRAAVICVTGGPISSNVSVHHSPKFMKFFADQRIFSTMDPIDVIVSKLNDFNPDTLVCYPSLLELLAHEKLDGRLKIKLDSPMSSILTGSEVLSEAVKAKVRKAWNIEIQDTYGLSECPSVARTCKQFEGMHLMSDLCIYEVVNKDGKPVPDGTVGAKAYVTNLMNYAQPFIRYEVTDVTGISTERCACGSPFAKLLPIQGRTNDIFYIDRPGGGYEAFSAYRFGFTLLIDGLKQFQLEQRTRNHFVFHYVSQGITPEALRTRFEHELKRIGLHGRIQIDLKEGASLPRDEKSGKFRQYLSLGEPPKAVAASNAVA